MNYPEPPAFVDSFAHRVIGAAIDVHRILGPGYQERTYHEALAIELELRGIPFASEVPVQLRYRDRYLATEFRLDLVVAGVIVVELKAVERLMPIHFAQTVAYLGASGLPLGLVLNFHGETLKDGIRRVLPRRPPSEVSRALPGE